MRPPATGSSPRPSPCATRSSTAGWPATRQAQARQREAGLLSEPRVPDRPAARRCDAQPRAARAGHRGLARARRRPGGRARGRARRSTRQWRPRPARRLLPRQHGEPRHRRLRLRHPLRARPVPPGPRRRLAGRAAGELAGVRQSLGVRAAEIAYPIRFYGAVRETRGAGRRSGRSGKAASGAGGGLRHADRRLAGPAHQHAAPVVGAEPEPDRPRIVQPRRLHAGRRRAGPGREHQPASSTPTTPREAGQELRLKQEYFFTSASLQDIVRRHLSAMPTSSPRCPTRRRSSSTTPTRPWPCPSCMRLLVDEHGLDWTGPGRITRETIHYTNHTLMPEALERWPVPLIERLLPRHLQIIYDINAQVLGELRRRPDDRRSLPRRRLADRGRLDPGGAHGPPRLPRLAQGQRRLGTAHRADEADGVQDPAPPLSRPDRQQTNGITPRRWLMGCNPGLAGLLRESSAPAWLDDLERLAGLRPLAEDAAFRDRFAAVKRANKERLAALVAARHDLASIPPPCSTSRSSVSTSTSGSSSICSRPWPCGRRSASAGCRLDAARQAVRRQGRQQLCTRQADHQAGQRRRPGGQRRSPGRRPAQGRLSRELQCQPGRDDGPGSRPVRADLDRRDGGLGHRQHEVRAQRGLDHRHARRRQHRDPRAGRVRTISSCSA